jgi:hypothetical protein
MTSVELRLTAPPYCHYADRGCDQQMPSAPDVDETFFLYGSDPDAIAYTIEAAVKKLPRTGAQRWCTWRDLPVPGQIIFCEICKGMRRSATVVADVTTLNFNVLFEIGYAIGLGIPIIPVRDTNYIRDKRLFDALGVLDTLGYLDFANSDDLVSTLPTRLPGEPLPNPQGRFYKETPLYVLKGPINTEGAVQLLSTLKKSRIRWRGYDQQETPRISLNELRRQVDGSVGVIANLLPTDREGAAVHNALCALACGYALAKQKVVLMLQEGLASQPIDYRDLVQSYSNAGQVPNLLRPTLERVLDFIQTGSFTPPEITDLGILRRLDLGDVAAENEIFGLHSYFVTTGQAIQALQGHARLVIGRKGSGKTAIFYDVRMTEGPGFDRLVLDLKPEGHQFTRLGEFISERMPVGLQEYTMVAFWTYILLTEMVRRVLEEDRTYHLRDPRRLKRYTALEDLYERHDPGQDADFSQRLLRQVTRITTQLGEVPRDELGEHLTRVIYAGDVRALTDGVTEYLEEKKSVWLLLDNLDKGWPLRGATDTAILIVRSLLDATRKLQQMLEVRGANLKCLVFLRSDIYERLQTAVPDKGKDTVIQLDWEDPAVFETIIARRIEASTDLTGPFEGMWSQICEPLVGTQNSFGYIVDRTLMRPRDLLLFLHRALDTAINRGHHRIHEEDILHAEKGYSEDMLLATEYEITDTNGDLADVLYAFQSARSLMDREDALLHLAVGGIEDEQRASEVIQLLIWYGFFGVKSPAFPEVKYSYSVHGNIRRLIQPLEMADASLVIHPAFRAALDVQVLD